MALRSFQEEIESLSGIKLKLKINDNRSTMLSIRWESDCTKVSMHRIFLNAPQNVMQALSCYIRQKDKIINPTIKAFIEDSLRKLDYSHLIDRQKLHCQGNTYNLKKIYDELNGEYFQGKLNLSITWFGKINKRNRTRVTFGLYQDSLRLIKINRLLDSPSFPDYLVAYVIYHEMVHHVCPAYIDERGLNRIHNKEFKKKEMLFRHFALAQNWIKENQKHFFC